MLHAAVCVHLLLKKPCCTCIIFLTIVGPGLAVAVRFIKDTYKRRSLLRPLLWENTLKLPIEDVYTRLKIVSRRNTDFRLEHNKLVGMYDIFVSSNDRTVLVEGSPGIGKTTFSLKIAYDWANENLPKKHPFPEFKVVLLLKCRDVDGDLVEAISEQLLPEDENIRKDLVEYIQDIRNQQNILIILDGLDELPMKAESHVDRLFERRIFPFSFILTTSRQERGIRLRQNVNFDVLCK